PAGRPAAPSARRGGTRPTPLPTAGRTGFRVPRSSFDVEVVEDLAARVVGVGQAEDERVRARGDHFSNGIRNLDQVEQPAPFLDVVLAGTGATRVVLDGGREVGGDDLVTRIGRVPEDVIAGASQTVYVPVGRSGFPRRQPWFRKNMLMSGQPVRVTRQRGRF